MSRLPIIGVTDCSLQIGLYAHHISGDICVSAVAAAAPGQSVIFPSLADQPSLSDILDGLDGTPIAVTPFNIEPIHNSGSAIVQGTARDSARLLCAEVHTSTIAWRKLAFQRDADASTTA
ncbi:gamma-glutamyl-gamma-aminobutyrate hydrolase family protein [Pseudomonas sp. MHK4]|jgi:putative glutamine amidotransferase